MENNVPNSPFHVSNPEPGKMALHFKDDKTHVTHEGTIDEIVRTVEKMLETVKDMAAADLESRDRAKRAQGRSLFDDHDL